MTDDDDVAIDLSRVLVQLEALAKNATYGISLAERGVNQSILLVAVQGLRAYVDGRKPAAAEDFETAAEEIRARLKQKD